MYGLGLLKNDFRFKYHYMVKELIEDDYTVVDIGANLGYFSKNFAKLTPKGKVLSIEPVKPFFEVLTHFMKRFSHAEVVNYALGEENGTITMVLPESDGMIRTGLPHVAQSEEEKKLHKTHEVEVVKGSELLSKLGGIDYIKCDIEGYEPVVFNQIKEVVTEERPIIQIEIDPENELEMLAYFTELGYVQYGIADFKIIRESGKQKEQGDYLFVHSKNSEEFEARMKEKGKY
jgi:FkbM family methyltransferase